MAVADPLFDGTIRSVINLWQADPASPYHTLEASSRHPYNVYARMIVSTVGTRRVDALDGRDMRRWHAKWMEPDEAGGKPRLARARTAITILKTALTFAAGCRKSGCKELRDILRDIDFPGPRPRREAPTAPEIVAARKAVHELGHPAAALAYALQFEGTMRQWDVIGKWVPLADKRPSPMIDGGKKWVGPMWSQIDEHLILRYAPSKTQLTSGAEVVLDLKALPMVMEELAEVPEGGRRGPLIVNPRTGLRPIGMNISACCGGRLRRRWVSLRRSGIVTRAPQASPKHGRRRLQMSQAIFSMMWPSRLATPPSAPRRGSMTVTGWKRRAGWRLPGSPIGAKTKGKQGVS